MTGNLAATGAPAAAAGYFLEWGAVGLPAGDPARITCAELHPSEAHAWAAGAACGFAWRVYPAGDADSLAEPH